MIGAVAAGARRIAFSSAVNIVADGNSLFAMTGAGGPSSNANRVPDKALTKYPVGSSGATLSNVAISGQSWAQMTSTATDVDGAYVNGKRNILLLWEDTNAVYNDGKTVSQVMADKAAYISARRAAKAWSAVVCLTALPREPATDQAQRDLRNGYLDQINDQTWQQRSALGIDRIVDVRRAGSPYRFANYLQASWDSTQAWWGETAQNTRIHIPDQGADLIAIWVAQELARVRA